MPREFTRDGLNVAYALLTAEERADLVRAFEPEPDRTFAIAALLVGVGFIALALVLGLTVAGGV